MQTLSLTDTEIPPVQTRGWPVIIQLILLKPSRAIYVVYDITTSRNRLPREQWLSNTLSAITRCLSLCAERGCTNATFFYWLTCTCRLYISLYRSLHCQICVCNLGAWQARKWDKLLMGAVKESQHATECRSLISNLWLNALPHFKLLPWQEKAHTLAHSFIHSYSFNKMFDISQTIQ